MRTSSHNESEAEERAGIFQNCTGGQNLAFQSTGPLSLWFIALSRAQKVPSHYLLSE